MALRLLFFTALLVSTQLAFASKEEVVAKYGFASCNKQERSQEFWPIVGDTLARRGANEDKSSSSAVDGFIWLGDIVYNDHSPAPGFWFPSNLTVMEEKLQYLRHHHRYASFVDRVAKNKKTQERNLVGVWDDHDMGLNDGGKEYVDRDASQQLLLDFLDVAKNDTERRQRHGTYSSHEFGWPPHMKDESHQPPYENALCTILLDVRYDRDAIGEDNGDILGEEQWKWFERVVMDEQGRQPISARKCLVTAIGSGVQILSDEKPTEQWSHFPCSRQRLVRTIKEAGLERVIFLSGDVHLGEIQLLKPPQNTDRAREVYQADPTQESTTCNVPVDDPEVYSAAASPLDYTFVDITSSGLTHAVGSVLPTWLFDFVLPSKRRSGRYLKENFGSISIIRKGDEEKEGTRSLSSFDVVLAVHNIYNGSVMISQRLNLEQDLSIPVKNDNIKQCDVDRCHIAATSTWLKRLLFSVQRNLFPRLKMHRVIYIIVWSATAVLGLCVVALVMGVVWITRRCLRKRGAKAKRE